MRKWREYNRAAIIVICIAAVVAAASCKAQDGDATQRATTATTAGATPHPTSTPGDGVRRITPAESQKAVAAGEAVIVDVRDEAGYRQGHIKGSILIPRTQLVSRLNELPKDKLIIFYCA